MTEDVPRDEIYPWKCWRVPNPKGRIASVIAVAFSSLMLVATLLWWPIYIAPLFGLMLSLACLRFYQEWVEGGAWAK